MKNCWAKASAVGKDFFNLSVMAYKLRVQQTDSIIKAIMAKPLDFSKPDNITWPYTTYALNEQESAQRWQKYLKWRVLNKIAEKIIDSTAPSGKLPVDFVKLETEAREKIRTRELAFISNLLAPPALFISRLQDQYLNSIAWCYDPHTNYMSLKEKKAFDTDLSGTTYSAGLDLQEDEKGDQAISYLQPGAAHGVAGNCIKEILSQQ